jgi:hypothetical protein
VRVIQRASTAGSWPAAIRRGFAAPSHWSSGGGSRGARRGGSGCGARLLRSGQLQAEAAERALDVIVRNADAQVQLIDDLLEMSRIIAGNRR